MSPTTREPRRFAIDVKCTSVIILSLEKLNLDARLLIPFSKVCRSKDFFIGKSLKITMKNNLFSIFNLL